jgi:REP element-mobilizing transposase RayT
MANSYSQLYIQLIFAVKYRKAVLKKEWRHELFSVISGIINNTGCKSFIVNGVEDHVHCFLVLSPKISVSELAQKVKCSSSKWINERNLTTKKFQWQRGYGVFSYNQSLVDTVYKYVEKQETHHQKKSFKTEFVSFLEKFEVDYDDKYLFEELV